MTRPTNLLVSTILRNQRLRGATSSAQQNDFQAEVIRDITALQEQWNNLIIPLTSLLSDGTLDSSVNAFANGLDGKTLWANSTANSTLANGRFFSPAMNRPFTVYEQFVEVYAELDSSVASLSDQIASIGGGSGLTTGQQDVIGLNIFNPSLASSPSSLDGRSQSNQIHILQLAKDLYGEAFFSFTPDGAALLTNSVRAMVDALLELHGGNWDNDIGLTHSFTADDITSGTLNQDRVGPTSGSGTGVSDSFAGSPTNLPEDLNQLRTLIKKTKDASSSFSADLTLNANWSPVTTGPTDLKLLTNLKGSTSRSDTNPWGYQWDDIPGVESRLQAGADFAGQTSLTDDSPIYSSTNGFSNGDSLTTAIGGLAGIVSTVQGSNSSLNATLSGHLVNNNNPHGTTLSGVASAGGSAPAGQISVIDGGEYYTTANVESVLQEIPLLIATLSGNLTVELNTLSGVLTTDIETTVTTLSGLLQDNIETTATTLSGLLQDDIDSNTNILSVHETGDFRRNDYTISGLANDATMSVSHGAGHYPLVQVMTTASMSGYNVGSVLPIYQSSPHEHPGILIEHTDENNFNVINKMDEVVASGLILVKW